MGEFFGTDGIRGIPGEFPFVPDFIERIGFEAVSEILKSGPPMRKIYTGRPPFALIGRDTRASGVAITAQLSKGIARAGCDIVDLGVVPTPAVAYLAPRMGATCGIVISASHNPPEFNGIKFFSAAGVKLDEALERRIERRLKSRPGKPGTGKGRLIKDAQSVNRYADFIASTMPSELNLLGMRIVVDCANGAAYRIAAGIFARLGARVYTIGCNPDGGNINEGLGALHTDKMRAEVLKRKADCGISLDGDADRVIFSDETGAQMDGDDLIAFAAVELARARRLKWDGAVLTVMSNCGVTDKLKSHGIETVQVPVGDKYVTRSLENRNLSIGGEASGHIIFRDFSPTGDGLLTAVQILGLLKRSGRKLSYFRRRWTRYPHSLKAVPVEKKIPLESIPGFSEKIGRLEKSFNGRGRIYVRYSGTEPKLRVLVEGPDKAVVETVSRTVVDYYTKHTEGALCR